MIIETFECLEDNGLLYLITIKKRVGTGWRFWEVKTVTETYVGNALGWYNRSNGALCDDKAVLELINNRVRKVEIDKMLNKHNKPKLTPVK
jgi:hypothetical protein